MPTVKQFSRAKITMYHKDHAPPHFHIIATSGQVKVEIASLAIMVGQADSRDLAEAMEWARGNRPELMARWKKYSE